MTTTAADPFTSASAPAETYDGAYTVDGKPDAYKRYRLPDPKTGRIRPYTRVSTFEKTISNTFSLNLWNIRMAMKGLSQRPDLLEQVANLDPNDEQGKKTLNEIGEQAKTHAGAKSAASLGTLLHDFSAEYDQGRVPYVPEPWDKDIAAYRSALDSYGIEIVPELVERIVVNERFDVAGTFDRIVRLPSGDLVVADLKTGKDLQYGWNEIAVQLALYANSKVIFNKETKEWEKMPEVRTDTAIIFHLPVGKAECTFYDLDIASGYQAAKLCEAVRGWRKQKGLATPRSVTTATRDASGLHTSVVSAGWEKRIDSAVTVADLSSIFWEATTAGQWTDALEKRGLARRALLLGDKPIN